MGMLSEIHAVINADQIEKILLEAINENDAIKKFAKKHLYKWYLDECGESWGCYKPNSEIVKEFEKIE